MTFQQAKSLGGWVRQGERGVLLVLYREIEQPSDEEPEEEPTRRLFLAKGFTVLNLEQTSGLDHVRERLDRQRTGGFEPLAECERIIQQTGAVIQEGPQASYSPRYDLITMPPRVEYSISTMLLPTFSGSPDYHRQMRRVRPTPAHCLRTGLPEPSANDNRGGRFGKFMRMLASV